MPRPVITASLIVLALAGLWTAAWFGAATYLERTADRVIAEAAERGVVLACPDRQTSGFPFRLELSCDGATVRSEAGAAEVEGVSAGAELSRPRTVALDFGSPARLAAVAGTPVDLGWDEAGAELRLGLGGPAQLEAAATELKGAFEGGSFAIPAAAATVSPAVEGSSHVHITADDSVFAEAGSTTAPVDATLSAVVSQPPERLLTGRFPPAGAELRVSDLVMTLSGGGVDLQAAGELTVDGDGLPSGTVAVRIAGAEQLPAFLATLPERARALGNAAAGALMAMGQPATLDGKPAREVVFEIDRGEMRFGMLTLGRIPSF